MVTLVWLQVEGIKLRNGSASEFHPKSPLTTKPGFHLVGDHRRASSDLWLLPAERSPAGADLLDHDVNHRACNAALVQLSLFPLRRLKKKKSLYFLNWELTLTSLEGWFFFEPCFDACDVGRVFGWEGVSDPVTTDIKL